MRASKVEVVVLGLLAEGPKYGYQLLERFRSRGMGLWVEVGRASVYQTLRRLEGHRLVSGRSQEGTDGPDRRVYRITAAGRARLRAGVSERCRDAGPIETDAGLALGFVHLLPLDDARRAVAEREAAVRGWRSRIAEERARVAPGPDPGRAVALRMLELQEALAAAEERWLVGFGADLRKLRA
jgi:DNA-binding PadR family transcriptional regulator